MEGQLASLELVPALSTTTAGAGTAGGGIHGVERVCGGWYFTSR